MKYRAIFVVRHYTATILITLLPYFQMNVKVCKFSIISMLPILYNIPFTIEEGHDNKLAFLVVLAEYPN